MQFIFYCPTNGEVQNDRKFEVPSAAKYILCPSEFLISYLLFVSKLVNAEKYSCELL